MEGVFLSSDVPPPPLPAEEVPVAPSSSHQSPFRRQLFTSLITRQSALVSRINQQSGNLLKTMQAVAEVTMTHPPDTNFMVQKGSVCESEELVKTDDRLREVNQSCQENKVPYINTTTAEANVAPPAQVLQVHNVKRVGERLVSVCDSGLGWDTDDDQRTSSLGSFSTLSVASTLSEDSEDVPEDEPGKT